MIRVYVNPVLNDLPLIDITDWCVSVQWSDSISPPWNTINIRIEPPVPPRTTAAGSCGVDVGDWISIVSTATGESLSWCRVSSIKSVSKNVPPGARVRSLVVTAKSWLAVLMDCALYAPPGLEVNYNTVFSWKGWQQIALTAIGTVKANMTGRASIGKSLAVFVDHLARIVVHGGATKGTVRLGHVIEVVYDEATAEVAAPNRKATIDPVEGVDLAHISMVNSLVKKQTTVGATLYGTFVPDPGMIEMFPSMERGSTNATTANTATSARNATLIYRLKPWRTRSLAEALGSSSVKVEAGMFTKRTWIVEHLIPADEIFQLADGRDDVNTYNVFTANVLLMQGAKYFSKTGLPITTSRVERLPDGTTTIPQIVDAAGPRIYEVVWPFISDEMLQGASGGNEGSLIRYMRTIAAQAAQWYAPSGLLLRGSVRCKYRGDYSLVGRAFRAERGDGYTLTAYAEAVTHSIEFGPGGPRHAETNIEFTRGLYDDSVRDAVVNLTRIASLGNADASEQDTWGP